MPIPPPQASPIGAYGSNPFALLTLIAAPAVLTNASSVLALGTSNRFARAVDRARQLCALLEGKSGGADVDDARMRQLERAERRSILLLDALMAFYMSLGSFAAASLLSLVGAGLSMLPTHPLYRILTTLALLAGIVGVGGLVYGCVLLVRDTRLAVRNLEDESRVVRQSLISRAKAGDQPSD